MKRSKVEELIDKINTIKVLANDTKEGIQYYLDEATMNNYQYVRLNSHGNSGKENQTTMRENMKVIRRIALDIAKQIENDQA